MPVALVFIRFHPSQFFLLFNIKSDWIHSFMTNFVPALAPTACVQYQLRRRGKDGSRQHR
jgi:hypothetical protein